MNSKQLLIIFTRNLVYGKVKTRLAATIGHDRAFRVFKKLVNHTYAVTQQVNVEKIVYYSEQPEQSDVWNKYTKASQRGTDLGDRMRNALSDSFANGYMSVVIVGTDCFQINPHIITQAFDQLINHDVVIGPATDGGYYLIGMNSLHAQLFENIAWSTATVFQTTRSKCRMLSLSYSVLPVLSDIDEEKDLINSGLEEDIIS